MINKEFNRLLDKIIPESKIMQDLRAFIKDECHYELEIDETVYLNADTDYLLQTRAYIQAHTSEIFMNDHLEAVVYLGTEQDGDDILPLYGIMKMYYDLDGNFVSEDRFNVWGE